MPEDKQNMADEEREEVMETNDNKQNDSSEKIYSKKDFQEELSRVVGQEKARIERRLRKENKSNQEKVNKYESILRAGLELSDEDDVLNKTIAFYKEQGIDIPEPTSSIDDEDEKVLGRNDAKKIIDMYDEKEIEARANELAVKQSEKETSAREDAEFYALGEYLTKKLDEKNLKDSGIDPNILENKEFIEFASKFNGQTKKSEIYQMWEKIKGQAPKRPDSTGSSRSTTPDNQIKNYYTPEEVDKLSSEDLDNPEIFKRVRESMKHWK